MVLGQKDSYPEADDHLVGQVVGKSLKRRQTEGPESEQETLGEDRPPDMSLELKGLMQIRLRKCNVWGE